MLPESEIAESSYRMLDVTRAALLPWGVNTRVIVGSGDVLHAWSVPALGVKVDACPGRLNQVNFFRSRPGVFYGECSEICGANHRFMPICLNLVNMGDFLS